MASTIVKVAGHIYRLFRPKPMAERVDMSGRQVIVTGASPGSIGYETARTLAGWGADVVATCLRNAASLEESLLGTAGGNGLGEGSVAVRRLDLCDADSVAEFAAWYTDTRDGRLHVLINNAGVHKGVFSRTTVPPPSPDGFEVHWRTNYLGPFHLTSLLLPALERGGQESGDARILNVVSHLHETVSNESLFAAPPRYDAWDAYGRSKLALAHFTFELQRRFAGEHNLQAFAVDPGSVSTNLTRLEIPEDSPAAPLRKVFPRLDAPILLRPEHGAQTSIMCASRKPLQGGRYYERCGIGEAGATTADREVARRLWEEAEQWVSTL
ncbi:MAG: SDR family NAD(P)-dependent oxidoreductase [Gammaproteobacteria bacterium]|nr:SDR family NAD(P)-dependent oxidoreductase [Gammaproteobacteria bacterium]